MQGLAAHRGRDCVYGSHVSNSPNEVAALRMRALLARIEEEEGERRGWQSEVARILGLHPSYVSRILGGSMQSLGPLAVARVIRGAEIDPVFFSSETLTDAELDEALARYHAARTRFHEAQAQPGYAQPSRHRAQVAAVQLENAEAIATELVERFARLESDRDPRAEQLATDLADCLSSLELVQLAELALGAPSGPAKIGAGMQLATVLLSTLRRLRAGS